MSTLLLFMFINSDDVIVTVINLNKSVNSSKIGFDSHSSASGRTQFPTPYCWSCWNHICYMTSAKHSELKLIVTFRIHHKQGKSLLSIYH